MLTLRGIAASPGIAIGRARTYLVSARPVDRSQVDDVAGEVERFRAAVAVSDEELAAIQEKVQASAGAEQAKIIEAHRLILADPEISQRVQSTVQSTRLNAQAALADVAQALIDLFDSMENDYMRQRSADIRDVTNRVMAHLQGLHYGLDAGKESDVIIVAHDLHPSDTIQLDVSRIKGFVTAIGGPTSHTAIMARTRAVPAVVGLSTILEQVSDQTFMIVDGSTGEVFVDPDPALVAAYREKAEGERNRRHQLAQLQHEPTVTQDGHRVELAANIGSPGDAVQAMEMGAEGVGLFRSEFLFMNRDSLPSEDEQFRAYRDAALALAGKPLVIRTMDIGGDKSIDYLELPHEANPFLGYRAIRICLDRPELFKTQLRAILRASHFGAVKVMFPMIATLEEVRQAKAMLAAARAELAAQGIPFAHDMEIGIMVEIPAAALAARELASEIDFFSIGTNDLIQYTFAVDRMNEKVSHLYQPCHPAILRLVKMVVDAALDHGKWVGMCGEMAGDARIIPVLVGLGLDELSMSAPAILPARELIRHGSQEVFQELAHRALQMESAADVQALLE